jgi:hypothetical protein
MKVDAEIIQSDCSGEGNVVDIMVEEDHPTTESSESLDRKRRSVYDPETFAKRQKSEETEAFGSAVISFEQLHHHRVYNKPSECLTGLATGADFSSLSESEDQKRYCAALLQRQLLHIIGIFKLDEYASNRTTLDGMVAAFNALACVFSSHPCSLYYGGLIKVLEFWIPSINQKVKHSLA